MRRAAILPPNAGVSKSTSRRQTALASACRLSCGTLSAAAFGRVHYAETALKSKRVLGGATVPDGLARKDAPTAQNAESNTLNASVAEFAVAAAIEQLSNAQAKPRVRKQSKQAREAVNTVAAGHGTQGRQRTPSDTAAVPGNPDGQAAVASVKPLDAAAAVPSVGAAPKRGRRPRRTGGRTGTEDSSAASSGDEDDALAEAPGSTQAATQPVVKATRRGRKAGSGKAANGAVELHTPESASQSTAAATRERQQQPPATSSSAQSGAPPPVAAAAKARIGTASRDSAAGAELGQAPAVVAGAVVSESGRDAITAAVEAQVGAAAGARQHQVGSLDRERGAGQGGGVSAGGRNDAPKVLPDQDEAGGTTSETPALAAPAVAEEPPHASAHEARQLELLERTQAQSREGHPHHEKEDLTSSAAVARLQEAASPEASSEAGSGTDSDGGADGFLDETAVAISVLAAAAAASAEVAQNPHPHAPRADMRRRTGTSEQRPPRGPPVVVVFEGGGLRELQALVSSVRGPTIIDLQGRVVTLRAGADGAIAAERGPEQQRQEERRAGDAAQLPVASTALALPSKLQVPGWSTVTDVAKMLSQAATPPPQQQQPGKQKAGGSAAATEADGGGGSDGCLQLHSDDVTLMDGTLQLHRDCRVVVSGRRVTLRRVEVADAEASGWWRQANAMPATCLQPSALISVTSVAEAGGLAGTRRQQQHLARGVAGRDVAGDVASMELDDCSITASGRDRDLLRAVGSGVAVTARYCRLRGGANAAVAMLRASLHLDCCVVEGYAAAGVVALDSTVRAVGSRLLGAGSIIGLQAVSSSRVSALGCFLRGHASNVECMTGSTVDMQGCVLARPDCRYGLTLHPNTHSTHPAGWATQAAALGPTATGAGRVRLSDCELAHAVQVGGGELELERCTFAMNPAPLDAAVNSGLQITSSPELAAKLAAVAPAGRSTGAGGGGGGFAGSVAAGGSLRVVACRVGSGGEGEAVVVEAARDARVHLSGSPGVVVRRDAV